MGDPAAKRATVADLSAVPSHLVAEIVGGVLQTHPRPAPRRARASSRLGMRLGSAFDEGEGGQGGWWILDAPELHLPDGDVLVPDLTGWRVERMSKLPDTAFFTLVPDWICEVLSPSTEADDRTDKMPAYATASVRHAWLLDPAIKTLEVYRLDAKGWVLVKTFKGDAAVRAEPFDAVPLEMGALWRAPARR